MDEQDQLNKMGQGASDMAESPLDPAISPEAAEEVSQSIWVTFQSVLWAMLGVQSKKNASRDFSKGKASHFIVIGLLLAFGFVMTLIFVVSLVLDSVK